MISGNSNNGGRITTIAAEVGRRIADDILRGRILPGAKLDEQTLATRFKVSRTPVREALRQLLATGLVESIPHRGAVVTSFGPERLSQLYEAIGEIESTCARLATQRMSAIERKELQLAMKPLQQAAAHGDGRAYLDRSDALHQVIHRGSHNVFLMELARGYRMRSLPFRSLKPYTRERMRVSYGEHGRVIAAVLAHDAEDAARAMREHVATSLLRAIKTIIGKDRTGPVVVPRKRALKRAR
jgi:DNA-binding GntR family transcriptional regulator